MAVSGNAEREKTSYLELNLKGSKLAGTVNATVLTLDETASWDVTGDSTVAVLGIAPGAAVTGKGTVRYGQLSEGTVLPAAEGVTFVQDAAVTDDYEAKKMGPPPGMPGDGGPGMPPPPPPMG